MSDFFNIFSLLSLREIAIPSVGILMFAILLFVARPDQAHDRRGVAAALLFVIALIGLYGALYFGGVLADAIAKDAIVSPTSSGNGQSFRSGGLLGIGENDDDRGPLIAAFGGAFVAAIGLFAFVSRTLGRPQFGRYEDDSAARRIEPAYLGTACFLAASLILTAAPTFAGAAYNIIDDASRRAGEEALAGAIGSGLLLGASLLTLRYYYAGLVDLIFDTPDEAEADLGELEG